MEMNGYNLLVEQLCMLMVEFFVSKGMKYDEKNPSFSPDSYINQALAS